MCAHVLGRMCPFARVMVFFAVVTASLDVLGDEKEKDQSQKNSAKNFCSRKDSRWTDLTKPRPIRVK